jgi:hypothetical protein
MVGRSAVPTTTVARELPLDAEAAWRLVADARHHGRWIPLTRVELGHADGSAADARDAPQVGDEVLAVSGPTARTGGPGLRDQMRIEVFEHPTELRPGVAVFRKHDGPLRGAARIEVHAIGPRRSRVVWTEGVHLGRSGLAARLTGWWALAPLHLMLVVCLEQASREARRAVSPLPHHHATDRRGWRHARNRSRPVRHRRLPEL